MKIDGNLWMVVNPSDGSALYIATEKHRNAMAQARSILGSPPLTNAAIDALGYKAVKVTHVTFEGEPTNDAKQYELRRVEGTCHKATGILREQIPVKRPDYDDGAILQTLSDFGAHVHSEIAVEHGVGIIERASIKLTMRDPNCDTEYVIDISSAVDLLAKLDKALTTVRLVAETLTTVTATLK